MTPAPTLTTARLELRGPRKRDLAAFTAWVTRSARTQTVGGAGTEGQAWGGHTGLGLASEAAHAVLEHTFSTTGLGSVASDISADNAASIRVAERPGAAHDTDAPSPEETGTLVYRHTRNSLQRSVQ